MSTVGLLTLASAAAILTDFGRIAAEMIRKAGFPDLTLLPCFVILYMAVMFPLDIYGGIILPRRHGIGAHTTPTKYLAGAFIHGVLICGSLIGIHLAGSITGLAGCFAIIILLCLTGLAFQMQIATAVGGLKPVPNNSQGDRTLLVSAKDPAFSGSIVGLPWMERIVLPSKWQPEFGDDGMDILRIRRLAIIRNGWRNRGLALACTWVCFSWLISALMAGFPDSNPATTLNTVFYMTLFHFLGLLILPTPTRNMTRTVDHKIMDHFDSPSQFQSWVHRFSHLTDGEDQRHPWIESIFHPLPSTQRRLNGSPSASPWAAWNATRTMLFLSIFTAGILSRAVHCNVGRPDLWIIAPTD